MKNYRIIASLLVMVLGILSLPSCYRSVDSYLKEYRDPALFGEWLDLTNLHRIQTDSQSFVNEVRYTGEIFVGEVYCPDGRRECIYAVYKEGTTRPTLKRENHRDVYYTKGNELFCVYPPIKGSAPTHISETYQIKGDTLWLGLDYYPIVHVRKKVTADLFPDNPLLTKGKGLKTEP